MSAGLPLTLWYVHPSVQSTPRSNDQACRCRQAPPSVLARAVPVVARRRSRNRQGGMHVLCCMHVCACTTTGPDEHGPQGQVRSRRCNAYACIAPSHPMHPAATSCSCSLQAQQRHDTTQHSRPPGRIGVRLEDHWSPLRTRALFAAATHSPHCPCMDCICWLASTRCVQCSACAFKSLLLLALLAKYSPCTARLG